MANDYYSRKKNDEGSVDDGHLINLFIAIHPGFTPIWIVELSGLQYIDSSDSYI